VQGAAVMVFDFIGDVGEDFLDAEFVVGDGGR
jgi:hypothetical protein